MQNIGLTVEYRENEQVRLTSTMCAALAHRLINKVAEDWAMITEMAHRMRN